MSIECQKGLKVVRKCVRITIQDEVSRVVTWEQMCGIKPLSAIICLMKRGALQLPCASISFPNSQHIAKLTQYFSDILCEYIKHLIPTNLPVNVRGAFKKSCRKVAICMWHGSAES